MAQQNNQNARKKNDTGFVVLVSGVIILAIILGAILGAGAYVAGRKTIFPNITIAGVDVGGMSYDTARSTLLGANVGVPTGIQATAVLTQSVSVSVTSDEAGLTLPITEAVDLAYAYGRNGNFFKNLGSFINCVLQPHEVAVVIARNEDAISRPINRNLAVIVLKFIKLLHALAIRIVGINGRKACIVLFKIELDRVCAIRHFC